jgi:hypothetical protein
MKLKANLHFHTSDDPCDKVPYTLEEGIVRASQLGFRVLAVTLHEAVYDVGGMAEFARKHGIILIAGAEVKISGRHTVIINAHKDAEKIKSFPDLISYRNDHPESFVLAPHPYYLFHSLGDKLEKNVDLFDGIEFSWFYSKFFDLNKKASFFAKNVKKPFIATSDTHFLRYLDESYCIIESDGEDITSILSSLRAGKFENVSSNKKNFFTLLFIWLKYLLFL